MSILKRSAILAAGLALLGQGCLSPSPASFPERSPAPPSRTAPVAGAENEAPASEQDGRATFEVYTKEKYEAAMREGKPIILFFFANWCPTCAAEEPVFRQQIAETAHTVKAFRVNYNDSDTDADERALAKEFSVFLQHTLVYLDGDGKELKRTIGTQGVNALRQNIDALK